MAVAITQTANPAGGAGTTTVTYSNVAIGVAAPDRYIAVCAGAELTDGYPIGATIDFGAGALSMAEGTLAGQGVVYSRIFYAPAPAGATATLTVSFGASQGTLTHHIAVYRAVDCVFFAQSATNDTDADPISSGLVTIPTNGGLLAIASMAADNSTRTWAGATKDIDADAGTFQFTTAMSTTGGATTLTVSGANTEDGTLAWLIFGPNVGWPLAGNKRRGAAMAAMLATAFIAPPPQPQIAKKFSPALFEVAAATPDEPPGGYSPKIVSVDDPHPPQRGAQIASLLEQPVVVDDKIPYRQPSLAYWVPEYVAPQVGAKMAPLLEQQVAAEEKTPYQRPPDVTLHWIPSYVQPQRLAYLTPPPAYVTPGNEDEPPGGSAPKIVSLDDPPLPQVGARIAPLLEQAPAVVDDPPFRYRRFQWGEGPPVVTEITAGPLIESVDLPPPFVPFQDTTLWQPGPPLPTLNVKLVLEREPDDPPRLKHNQLQDRTAWQPPPPLPTLSGKLHADVLHVEPAAEEEATGGGWFVTGHLGKPRGGVVKRIIDDGETDDERRQRVFKEILGDLEQVVEDKKPVKVAQAVKAIKRIAKQAPQDTTRSDELIKALRRAEAARAEAERLEQLRIAMAIAHDIERALMAAAMLKYQNEQALIALLLAD
jgi:hypothetical protein